MNRSFWVLVLGCILTNTPIQADSFWENLEEVVSDYNKQLINASLVGVDLKSYKCDTGYYGVNGLPPCYKCEVGTYCGEIGCTECSVCEAGQYADEPASDQCKKCHVGYYNDKEGQVHCKACDGGFYSSKVGSTECEECQPGQYSERATASRFCRSCPSGTHNPDAGKALEESCIPCEAGQYQNHVGQMVCKACPEGSFGNKTGLDECHYCTAGHYQNESGQTECRECPVGQFTSLQGSKSCSPCDVGHFAGNTGSIICDACATGSHQNITGQFSCNECEIGEFQDKEGQATCKQCEVGTYCGEIGCTECSVCEAGQYADEPASDQCKKCHVGYYNDKEGQVYCKACDGGFYSSKVGSTECEECQPGQYSERATASRFCLSCPTGTHNPDTGKALEDSCIPCEAGQYQNHVGQMDCKACPEGTFNGKPGQNKCNDCEGGYHASTPGAESCDECIAGSFSKGGAANCTNCPKGQINTIPAQTSCTNCTHGTYADTEGQTMCESCPPDLDTEYSGATSADLCTFHFCPAGYAGEPWNCDTCKPGTFTARGNMTSCDQCDYGQYQAKAASTSCDSCTYPQTTYGKGSTRDSDCEGPEIVFIIGSKTRKTLIDSKNTGFEDTKKVQNNKGEWLFYSELDFTGDSVSVHEGEVFTKGDGNNKTDQVISAKSYYAVFPNVFCYLKDYAHEYVGTRSRDMHGVECKNSTGPGVCFADDDTEEPHCYIADDTLSPCGVPKCIWDYNCYTGNGINYRGDEATVNATNSFWPFPSKFNCTCQPWDNDSPTKHPGTHPNDPGMAKYGLRSLHCRNPDPTKYSRPWCYVGIGQNHDDCEAYAKKVPSEICPYTKKCSKEKYYTQGTGKI